MMHNIRFESSEETENKQQLREDIRLQTVKFLKKGGVINKKTLSKEDLELRKLKSYRATGPGLELTPSIYSQD